MAGLEPPLPSNLESRDPRWAKLGAWMLRFDRVRDVPGTASFHGVRRFASDRSRRSFPFNTLLLPLRFRRLIKNSLP